MPYEKLTELPDNVRKLPSHAQEIYRDAFNKAYDQFKGEDDQEPKAHASAWTAVKNGYKQGPDGSWVEKAARDDTYAFRGVELARTGIYDAVSGKVTFTVEDWDEAEAAYNEIKDKHHAPIKLGHDDEQKLLQEDGYPNAGFIENIRRIGKKLIGDLIDVPKAVADLIESGRYNARSLEAMRNVKIDGKLYPFVITGLALLGADLPAVDSLKDISGVYASHGLKQPEGEGVIIILAEQGAYEDVEALIDDLHHLLQRTESLIYKRGGAPKFRTLVKAAEDELKAIAKQKGKKQSTREAEMELKKLIELLGMEEDATEEAVLAEMANLKTQIQTLQDQIAKAGEGKDKTDVTAQLVDAQKRIVILEDERANDVAVVAVDTAIKARKFAPASRDTLVKMAISSPAEFGELLKATPENAVLAKKGEAGSDGGEIEILAQLEPTEVEIKAAEATGVTREELIEQKAKDAGLPVPEPIAKVLAERRKV